MKTIKAPNGKTEFIRPNFDAALYEELDDRIVGRLKNLPCYWGLDGTCWSFNNIDYNLIIAPNNWYEAIGEGVLCWVWDKGLKRKTVTLITNYSNTKQYKFFNDQGKWAFAEPLTQKEVIKYIAKSDTIDSKWRVPSIQELLALVDYSKHNPASKECIKSERYWSSTKSVVYTSCDAWYVDFYWGYSDCSWNDTNYYVRCVRNTPTGLEWSEDSEKPLKWSEAFDYANELNAKD